MKEQKMYPKEYCEWLSNLQSNAWSSVEKSYEYWLKKVKNNFRDITTFEKACIWDNLNIDNFFILSETKDVVAYKKLRVIIKAVNQGWTPDWTNKNQKKWFPYFEVLSSGLGFRDSHYGYTYTDTSVGSRLCFETSEKAEYAGKQFIKLYEDFLL